MKLNDDTGDISPLIYRNSQLDHEDYSLSINHGILTEREVNEGREHRVLCDYSEMLRNKAPVVVECASHENTTPKAEEEFVKNFIENNSTSTENLKHQYISQKPRPMDSKISQYSIQ